MTGDLLMLALGVAFAGAGGELFLAGLVRLAAWARISAAIAATTVAAFATSSPELSVAISSALAGAPEISLGDALGSNVVNVALILGLAALIAPVPVPRGVARRDSLAALLGPIALSVLAADGLLSRVDGMLLICAFAAWLAATLAGALRERRGAQPSGMETRPGGALALSLAGLALLAFAGRLIVSGAHGLAERSGVHEFVIGATVVALGTSVPELSVAVVAQLRRRHEIGLGTVLGSNVFNGWFIIGVAALICPIRIVWADVAWALLFGALTVALMPLRVGGVIGRPLAVLLLLLYVSFLAVTAGAT